MSHDTFEFIVIGSGAGGGPVAANLARAGRRVLLLEAGGDGDAERSRFSLNVPDASPRLDPELGWIYWINSRARQADREQQHFYVPGKGLYYPRGTSLGGSTNVNAMITLYPDNSDWDEIAALTGDSSWEASEMRTHFQRLEQARYVKPEPGNPERHGFDGWLPLETVGMRRNLFKDPRLTEYVASRVGSLANGDYLRQAAANGDEFRVDPNAWSFVSARKTGVIDPPRSSDNGARSGTRHYLLRTAAEFPENLTIRTNCLATKLIFDEAQPTRVIGVEYLEGPHLYGASWLAEEFASQQGVRRESLATREVILSAGAFNSPQLLMLSGIGPEAELSKHGIPVRVRREGVGRNLQDRLEAGVVCKLPFQPNLYENCTFGEPGDPGMAEFDTGSPDGAYRSRLSRQLYITERSDPQRDIPNLSIIGLVSGFRAYCHPSRVQPSGNDEFTWFTITGHGRNTGGTVDLASTNPRDTPEINFNNFEDGSDSANEDLEALLGGVKLARRIAAGGADGPAEGEISPGPAYQSDDELRQFLKNEAWGHHASCTNRMGPANDPMAVVDSRFRVHGVQGLRIVDASIFPRTPGLYIVLPIFMAAEKASLDILASEDNDRDRSPA